MSTILAEQGYLVERWLLPSGYWRLPQQDVLRWQAHCVCPDGLTREIGSWDTITDCIRNGFTLDTSGRTMSGAIEVHANARGSSVK